MAHPSSSTFSDSCTPIPPLPFASPPPPPRPPLPPCLPCLQQCVETSSQIGIAKGYAHLVQQDTQHRN